MVAEAPTLLAEIRGIPYGWRKVGWRDRVLRALARGFVPGCAPSDERKLAAAGGRRRSRLPRRRRVPRELRLPRAWLAARLPPPPAARLRPLPGSVRSVRGERH